MSPHGHRPGHRRLLSEPVRWRPTVSSPLASSCVVFTEEPESYSPELPSYPSGSRSARPSAHNSPDSSDDEPTSCDESGVGSSRQRSGNTADPRRRMRRRNHKRSASFGDIDIGHALNEKEEAEVANVRVEEAPGHLWSVCEEPQDVPTIAPPPPYAAMRLKPSFDFTLPPIPCATPPSYPGHLTMRRRSGLPSHAILVLFLDAALTLVLHLFFAYYVTDLDIFMSSTSASASSRQPFPTDFFGNQTKEQLEPLCAYARTLLHPETSAEIVGPQWRALIKTCDNSRSGVLGVFSTVAFSHFGVWLAVIAVKAILGFLVLRTCRDVSLPGASLASPIVGSFFDVEKQRLNDRRGPRSPRPSTTAAAAANPASAYLLFSAVVHFIVAFLGYSYFSPSLPLVEHAIVAGPFDAFVNASARQWEQLSASIPAPVLRSLSSIGLALVSFISGSCRFLFGAAIGLAILAAAAIPTLWCGRCLDASFSRFGGPDSDRGFSVATRTSRKYAASPSAAAPGVSLTCRAKAVEWFKEHFLLQDEAAYDERRGGRWEEGLVLVEGSRGFKWEKRRWWVDSRQTSPPPSPSSPSAEATPSLA